MGWTSFGPDGTLDLGVTREGGIGFHTDGAYDAEPFKATQLYALAIPSRGGNTYFASMYAAYDALPDALRRRLEGVRATYLVGHHRNDPRPPTEEYLRAESVSHPILARHPETGRNVLYFDATKVMRIEGMDKAESDALSTSWGLRGSARRAVHAQWVKGDVVIWDNACSFHKALRTIRPEEDRIHWRVSIKEPAQVH